MYLNCVSLVDCSENYITKARSHVGVSRAVDYLPTYTGCSVITQQFPNQHIYHLKIRPNVVDPKIILKGATFKTVVINIFEPQINNILTIW